MSKAVKFHLAFSQAWVLSQRESDVLPVDWFVNEIKAKFEVSDIESRISECNGIIELRDSKSSEELMNELNKLIADRYDIKPDSDIFVVELSVLEKSRAETVATSSDGNVRKTQKPGAEKTEKKS